MTTIERLEAQTRSDYFLHFFALAGVKPTDTRKAEVVMQDGTRREFDAPASACFSAWDGYWSNFRLADYAGAVFPGAVMAGYK